MKSNIGIRDVTASNGNSILNTPLMQARSGRSNTKYMEDHSLYRMNLNGIYICHRNYSSEIKADKNVPLNKLYTDKVLNKDSLNKLKKNEKYYNLISLLCDVDFLIECHDRIKSNPGNISKGTTNETLDGLNMKFFEKLAVDLRSGKFKFKAGRIKNIPKKGPVKYRQLTILSPRDKIVHTALLKIMEMI